MTRQILSNCGLQNKIFFTWNSYDFTNFALDSTSSLKLWEEKKTPNNTKNQATQFKLTTYTPIKNLRK